MEFIEKFGVDFRLLIAQIVNFFILLFVLYRFAYKPILNALENRSKRIAKSLEDAKAIETRLAASETEYERRVNEAQQRAEAVVAEARQQAEAVRTEIVDRAKADVQAIVTRTQTEVAALKRQVIDEAKAELADLVVDATGKVIATKLTKDADLALVEEAIRGSRQ